jgi:UDP-glucose 4-epimerase
MSVLITGGAGFIGTNLVEKLCQTDRKIIVIDKLIFGNNLTQNDSVVLIRADLSNQLECEKAFLEALSYGSITEVWHLAANSDIALGVISADIDLKNTFLTTYNVINEMRRHNLNKLYFASTSAIYGDLKGVPVGENSGPLLPISNYGAMKLASEALISVAREQFLTKALIFRFPNVVGVPATHGVIYDFIRKIKKNGVLDVLGDGSQRKSYLHVDDLIDAMTFLKEISTDIDGVDIYNIGPSDSGILVSEIAEIVISKFNRNVSIRYGSGNKGWVGDVPAFSYDVKKLKSTGWVKILSSKDAVIKAVNQIINGA